MFDAAIYKNLSGLYFDYMRLRDIPVYDHDRRGDKSFRASILERIRGQVGGYALADPDIAFESVSTRETQQELAKTLAEFRMAELALNAQRSL